MTIVIVALVAILLWMALYGLKRLPSLFSFSAGLQARIRSMLPAVSLIAWILFGIWAVRTIVPEEVYATTFIAVVLSMFVLLFGWFVLRDLVAGIVFSGRHPALRGVHIEASGFSGKVIHAGLLGIQLRGEAGETIFLPYSTLARASVAVHPPERTADEFRLQVAIPGEANGEEAADLLRRQMLLSPWVNAERPPTVQVSGSGEVRIAEVLYHCLNEEHALHVEELLRQTYRIQRPAEVWNAPKG